MNVSKVVIVAAALLVGAASAVSAQVGSCITIQGVGSVLTGPDCTTESGGGSTVMITLQGSIDIVTRDLANKAIVSCWVCEAGNCNTSSVYGPSKVEWDLPAAGSNRSLIDWTVPFRFGDTALASTTVSFPSLASYYCRLELEYRPRGSDSGAAGPPAVPDVFANYTHARAEQGTNLVVELQGAFAQPVSNRAQ
jgi:hypothetical protein